MTLTEEQVKAAIVPRSDQLNADDLIGGPATVTITGAREGSNKEQPIEILLAEFDRPWRPCKTMLRIISTAYTVEAVKWVGHQLILYRDPEVTFGPLKVGGIRISHMTGLENNQAKTFCVTASRTKKVNIRIEPLLPSLSATEEAYIADAQSEIAAAETPEMLKAIGFILQKKSQAVQKAVRPLYAAKLAEIKSRTTE